MRVVREPVVLGQMTGSRTQRASGSQDYHASYLNIRASWKIRRFLVIDPFSSESEFCDEQVVVLLASWWRNAVGPRLRAVEASVWIGGGDDPYPERGSGPNHDASIPGE
jgi:hypothetical protein